MSEVETNAFAVKDLHKSYGPVEVLKDINVSIEAGDFLVLVGPSGCGKSTLLNCIAGLEETTSGEIWVAGRDVTAVPPRDRDIAMVFQSYALYPTMSVEDNMGFGMKIRRVPTAERKDTVKRVAQMLQIDELLDRRPSQLSGGQRQRVAMGRALVRDPALYLFDEPLSNLDAKLRVEMRKEIRNLHERTKATIVYVTHDQVEAMTLATKIVVLKDGIVQQVGSPAEIYESPANTFVADFMGSPPMNLLPAEQRENGLSVASSIQLPLPSGPAGQAASLTVGIRPEDIILDPTGPFTLTTQMVEKTGPDAYVSFALPDGNLLARVPAHAAPKAGDEVQARLNLDRLSYFETASGLSLTSSP